MRTSIFAIASCLSLLGPVSAMAQDQQSAPVMQSTSDSADPHRLICRYSYYEGTVIPRARECHTKHDWDRIRFQTQKELTDFQSRALLNNSR